MQANRERVSIQKTHRKAFPVGIDAAVAYDTEKSLYILNDGYVGFGFVSMPLSGVDDTVTQRLNAFLTFDYPEGSFIQIMLLASPDIRVRMEAMLNMRDVEGSKSCLLYTSPSPRDGLLSRMPSSA